MGDESIQLGQPWTGDEPIDFFTNEERLKLHKRRLRYLVARFSCYTSLMCWELFNEQENAQLKKAFRIRGTT